MPDISEFLVRKTRLTELAKRYNSVQEILDDKNIKYYAASAEMTHDEFVNLLLKQMFAVNGILEQKVRIKLNGEVTDLDIFYKDFITVRSGPKFSGHLESHKGSEYLANEKESQAKREQFESNCLSQLEQYLLQNPGDNQYLIKMLREPSGFNAIHEEILNSNDENLKVFFQRLQESSSILLKSHKMQRRLTDYDLVASSLDPLIEAMQRKMCAGFAKMLEQEKTENTVKYSNIVRLSNFEELSDKDRNYLKQVAVAAWQLGGEINLDDVLLRVNYKKENAYREYLEKEIKKDSKGRYHMIQELEQNSRKILPKEYVDTLNGASVIKMDANLGLGFEFQGPEFTMNSQGELELKKEEKKKTIKVGREREITYDVQVKIKEKLNFKGFEKLDLNEIVNLLDNNNFFQKVHSKNNSDKLFSIFCLEKIVRELNEQGVIVNISDVQNIVNLIFRERYVNKESFKEEGLDVQNLNLDLFKQNNLSKDIVHCTINSETQEIEYQYLGKKVSKFELGDIICDSNSYFANHLNQDLLDKKTYQDIADLCEKYSIDFVMPKKYKIENFSSSTPPNENIVYLETNGDVLNYKVVENGKIVEGKILISEIKDEHGNLVFDNLAPGESISLERLQSAQDYILKGIARNNDISYLSVEDCFKVLQDNELKEVLQSVITEEQYKIMLEEASEMQNKYHQKKLFVNSASIFEEVAKKEAQMQSYKIHDKTGKMLGNIVDITSFMKKAMIIQKGNTELSHNAKVHLQIAKLSFLLNVSRWGVGADDGYLLEHTKNLNIRKFNCYLQERNAKFMDNSKKFNQFVKKEGLAQGLSQSKFTLGNIRYYSREVVPFFYEFFNKHSDIISDIRAVLSGDVDKEQEVLQKFKIILNSECKELIDMMKSCGAESDLENLLAIEFLQHAKESLKFNDERRILIGDMRKGSSKEEEKKRKIQTGMEEKRFIRQRSSELLFSQQKAKRPKLPRSNSSPDIKKTTIKSDLKR